MRIFWFGLISACLNFLNLPAALLALLAKWMFRYIDIY
jgi:hypothetical protein